MDRHLLSVVERKVRDKLNILQKITYVRCVGFCVLVVVPLCISSKISDVILACGIESTQRDPIPTAIQEKKEITIRNVTKETIHYTVCEAASFGKPVNESLAKGEINRFPGDVALDITFMHGDEEMTYRIEPGTANSFRYDENGILDLFKGAHGKTDIADLAPYLETPMSVVEKMLEMAELDTTDILYDIGSGDGRIVIAAAKKYGAHAVGIELDSQLVNRSIASAKDAGVEELVTFRLEDATKANLSEATVVTMYLLTESNELMRPHLERQLRLGTYVLTHNYAIERWENKLVDYVSLKAEDAKDHSIYLYRR